MPNQSQPILLTPRQKYVQDCYIESFNFLQARKRRQVKQLVLLNNLNRGDMNIASTLLLTLFNRSVSQHYDDKLQVKFLPSQGITQNQLNSYNILAQSDYIEMKKAKLDYDWNWDALGFGRGYCETLNFNKKRKIMEPAVINPLVMGYDPYFEEVQEWRYYWKWITKSKQEIQRLIKNSTITGIKEAEEIPSGVDPYLWNYKLIRDQAKKAIEPGSDSMGGDIFQILEFYSYDDNGNKQCEWWDKDMSKVLYQEKLDLEDLDYGDGDVGSKWPIVVKEAFREPHSSVTFGIFDLLEDKHRAKNVLLNLAFIAAKDKANPLYWYNSNVSDITQFLSRQVNQHIQLNDNATGENSVGPLNTQEPMSAELLQFISLLTTEANDPIGTGATQQPEQSKKNQTATSDAIDQQLNDMSSSLQSKILQFGEQEFWSHWFHRYAKNADELGEKMANIVGVKGIDSKMIDLKDFNTDFPPGVMVYSSKEAEYKNQVKVTRLTQNYANLQQSMDVDGFRNFNKHVYFPLILEDPSLIDLMFPKTLDEIKAEEENQQLADEKYVAIQPTDNHVIHLYTHMTLQPKTWALWFHIFEHEKALAENAQPGRQQQGQQGGQSGQEQQKVSESIAFKDLPPDGQAQMAAQAGIKIDPTAIASMQQQGSAPPKPQGKGAKVGTSPLAATTPLKTLNQSNPLNQQ